MICGIRTHLTLIRKYEDGVALCRVSKAYCYLCRTLLSDFCYRTCGALVHKCKLCIIGL